jgi:hypothetical protein
MFFVTVLPVFAFMVVLSAINNKELDYYYYYYSYYYYYYYYSLMHTLITRAHILLSSMLNFSNLTSKILDRYAVNFFLNFTENKAVYTGTIIKPFYVKADIYSFKYSLSIAVKSTTKICLHPFNDE